MKTCGERLVELLDDFGIDTVFGIPGVHTVEFYRNLPASGLQHITPRHEQGAGFMADGFARASGRVAACFIITGPGMTNITTAMAQACADSVPMLVISSVNNTHELGKGDGRLHELPDQRGLIAGVSAFSHTLLAPDELPSVLARAFTVFNCARPRPVHIQIPLDVIRAPAGQLDCRARLTRARPAPDPGAITRAADLLRGSEGPMAVFGGGAQDAAAEVRRLVESLGIMTVLTNNAKGLLPPGHPLSLGSTLPQPPVMETLQTADVVLAVGTELGETDTLLFDQRLEIGGALIRIDIDAGQLSRNRDADVGIVSDAGLACRALVSELAGYNPDQAKVRTRVESLRKELAGLLQPMQRIHQRFLETVRQALPGVIIAGDSTQPVYSANLFYEAEMPRSYFSSSTGYGTLGYALPAAIGAKLARPDRPVVALIGDGGLQFTIAELASATELELGLPVLVWNNQGYGEIKRFMLERGITAIGVDIYTPDFQVLARGFGCSSVKPETPHELKEALGWSVERNRPTLIEIDEAAAQRWWGGSIEERGEKTAS